MNGTKSKVTSRTGWMNPKDIPPVSLVSSTESTNGSKVVGSKYLVQTTIASPPPTSPVRRQGEDFREDEQHCRSSRDRLDRTEALEDAEMGFEVEMSFGESDSKEMTDGTISRNSLDFSISRASAATNTFDSMKSSYNDFKRATQSNGQGGSTRDTPQQSSKSDSRKNELKQQQRRNQKSIKNPKPNISKGPLSLVIDDSMVQLPRINFDKDLRDDTPKTTNRSTEATFFQAPVPKVSLKNKKKEGVAKTLATIVQQVDSPINQVASIDEMDAEDDSSAEVDARWEQLSAKLLNDEPAVQSLDSTLSEDHLLGEWRDNLLDVNSATSPRSLFSGGSDTFQDELIQDCLETGLPSPERRGTVQVEEEDGNVEGDASVQDTISAERASPLSYPSSLPALHLRESQQKDGMHESQTRELNQTQEVSRNGREVYHDTSLVAITSALTADDDGSQRPVLRTTTTRDDNNLRLDTIRSLLDLSSNSNKSDPTINGNFPLASEYENYETLGQRYDQQQYVNPYLLQTPKIEVSLESSSSGSVHSSDEGSDNSSFSCRKRPTPPDTPVDHSGLQEATELQNRLLWWRQHEKLKGSVHAKPDTAQLYKTDDTPSDISQRVIRPTESKGMASTEQLVQRNQTPGSSEGSVQEPKSAFQRGLAMFEKGQKATGESISPRNWRKGPLSPSSSKMTMVASNQSPNAKVARAPQPNPDAESSNSRNRALRVLPLPVTAADDTNAEDLQERQLHNPQQETSLPSRVKQRNETLEGNSNRTPSTKLSREILPNKKSEATSSTTSTVDRGKQRVILTGKRNLDSSNDDKSKSSEADESEIDAQIINVASTLTGGTSVTPEVVSSDGLCSTPTLRKSRKSIENQQTDNEAKCVSDRNMELSVCFKTSRSFDTQVTASSAGVPSWRLEPTESLADFTIEIATEQTKTQKYYVHKYILAVGPRRSEHLEVLFRSQSLSTTTLKLVDGAVDFIPQVLDFIYCHDYEFDLTTENVVAYRYLAKIFKISPILERTADFILTDIKIENMSTYITSSVHYKDDTLIQLIAAKCGEEIEDIETSDVLWTVMDPHLFSRVLSCPKIDRKLFSPKLSLLLAEYQMLHKYEMSANQFAAVSTESLIPSIDRSAAIPLLEVCEEYGAPVAFQPLQKRCAHVMAHNWKTTSEQDRRRLFSLLRSLPSNFTVDFLEMVETGKTSILMEPSPKASNISAIQDITKYMDVASFTLPKLCEREASDTQDKEKDRSLSWRMDAETTFSDWTIKVNHRKSDQVDVYYVHKHILSIGPYKSNFFSAAFLNGDQAHSRRGTTIIELASEPASMVPSVLDFIYSPEHDLDISTATAPALRFLARVFGVWMLNKKVLEFVHGDMDLSNMLLYLERSELYDDDRLVNIAVRKCAAGINDVHVDSALLRGIKPDFFGRVVASSEIDKSASCHINILIAKYFTLHDLNESLLAELMKQVPMKVIEFEPALKLLEVMSSVKTKGVEIFGDIQRRCCDVLRQNWKELREENRELAFKILRTLDSALLADLFDGVENDYYHQYYETMSIQSKLVKRYRSQLADAKIQRENELEKVRQEMEMKMAAMLEKQQELEAELAHHQEATSRRALRSNGGFSHCRVSSPRQTTQIASRESMIPRPNGRSQRSKKESPRDQRSQQQTKDLASNHDTVACSDVKESQSSILGRMFACGITDTTAKTPPPLTSGKLPAALHFHSSS